jgi:hypothetical protein
MQPKISLSLIVFCYNEAGNIGRVIDLCCKLLPDISSDYELIVIDDGSSDSTADEVMEKAASFPALRLIRHEVNKGIGNALRSGYAAATKEYVCALPCASQQRMDGTCHRRAHCSSTQRIVWILPTNRIVDTRWPLRGHVSHARAIALLCSVALHTA